MGNLAVLQPPPGADLWNHFVLLSAAKVSAIRSQRIHFNSAVEGDKRRRVLCLRLSVNIIDTLKSTIRRPWRCIMQLDFNEQSWLCVFHGFNRSVLNICSKYFPCRRCPQ